MTGNPPSSCLNGVRMTTKYHIITSLVMMILTGTLHGQAYLTNLEAGKDDPIYTTYAAPLSRSEFVIDEGYIFKWYDSQDGIDFETDNGGSICIGFKLNGEFRYYLHEYFAEPLITTSYSDLVKYYYYPFEGILVEIFFDVYSSRIAIQDIHITNESDFDAELTVYPFFYHHTDEITDVSIINPERDGFIFQHKEIPDGWTTSHDVPYQEELIDVYIIDSKADDFGAYSHLTDSSISMNGSDYYAEPGGSDTEIHGNSGRNSGHNTAFFSDVLNRRLSNTIPAVDVKIAAMQKSLSIPSGQSSQLRIIRGVAASESDVNDLIAECRNLRFVDLQPFVEDAEQIYSSIPNLTFSNHDYEMLYWSAFSLMRQCMMPPEGECSYNYYVFSREPTWGWGHGGQVFHESLVMIAYAFMDGQSAMNSQRVYMERQWEDGYINYRTGPYLNETIYCYGQYTTSAPLFNWENWEIYKITEDTLFLQEAYQAGSKFYQYWLDNRNADGDSLCEWGAHAVLESLRDGSVAVWDQVGWPSNFECIDLNVMLVSEAHSLAQMALELGNTSEYDYWTNEAAKRTEAINNTFWDEQTNFFYHVDKTDHDFTYSSANDLKRQEIIGFLPLWANSATADQAEKLVQVLTDPAKFWRAYGIPSLAADDGYYNPKGYWNGPVWVQWQYLIFRGLINYGYYYQAKQLAYKVLAGVIEQLKNDHNLWELYSPDDQWAGYHKTYIWTAIAARMLIDLNELETGLPDVDLQDIPKTVLLKQNYPNPFNPSTVISFELPRSVNVKIDIFNILGQKVRTLASSVMKSGIHEIKWDGRDDRGIDAAGGIYIYKITAEDYTNSKKMLLIR